MATRNSEYKIIWKHWNVGTFRKKISDARWYVGIWEPEESDWCTEFLSVVSQIEVSDPHIGGPGVPIIYRTLTGFQKKFGIVERLGAGTILDVPNEMIINRLSPEDVIITLQEQLKPFPSN